MKIKPVLAWELKIHLKNASTKDSKKGHWEMEESRADRSTLAVLDYLLWAARNIILSPVKSDDIFEYLWWCPTNTPFGKKSGEIQLDLQNLTS